MELRTTSAADTHAVGRGIATVLRLGDVLVLTGDLGAGKTVLAQGVAAGLGVTDRVVSPTFALARRYQGRVPLHHLDVYRLDRVQEAIDLGLEELLDDGVVVIEWGEGVHELLPAARLEVRLRLDPDDEDARRLTLVGHGDEWDARADALAAAVATARAEAGAC
jgi:tRNA threonylcarbamoyladenosine biosynthesis protein TsaE